MTTTLTRGDKGFDLNFQVLQNDGKIPVDISTATVRFKMALPGASENKIDAVCTVTEAGGPNGECKYTVQSGDLDTADSYVGELEVTFSEDKVLTAKLGTIKVEEDLPE
jgi:hypothetical protein